jgi:hypothetical protein
MAGTADTHAVNKWCHLAFVAAKDAMRKGSALAAVHKRVVIGAAAALLVMPLGQASASTALTAVRTPDGVVLRGTSLYLASKPWQFTGVNAPEAASDYAINGGCGAEVNVLSLFDSLPRNSVVRVNFDQDETIDVGPDVSPRSVNRDWRGLDQVVAAADKSTTRGTSPAIWTRTRGPSAMGIALVMRIAPTGPTCNRSSAATPGTPRS